MTIPSGGYTSVAAALADNLEHYWHMDEASGTTVEDMVGGIDITVTGDAGDDSIQTGILGNCRDITNNGQGGNAVLPIPSGVDSNGAGWAVSVWFWLPSGHTYNGYDTLLDLSNYSYGGIKVYTNSNGTLQIDNETTYDGFSVSAGTLNTWNHLLISQTWDGQYDVWVNGSAQTGLSGTASDINSANGTLHLGSEDGSSKHWPGKIDEVGIFYREATSTDATNIYNSGTGVVLVQPVTPSSESLFDQHTVGDSISTSVISPDRYDDTASDTITNSDSLGTSTGYYSTHAESVSISLVGSSSITTFLNEIIHLTSSYSVQEIANIIESSIVSGSLDSVATQNIGVIDIYSVADSILVMYLASIIDGTSVSLSSSQIIQAHKILIESIDLIDENVTQITFNTLVTVLANLFDVLSEVTPISENIQATITDVATVLMDMNSNDSVEISSNMEEAVTFLVLQDDEIEMSQSMDSSSNVYEELGDNVQFYINFQINNVEYSGWVMNPENYAISNYDNHPFNSMATYSDRVLFAGGTGLYYMDGTNDNGSYITSTIETAALSFGTSNLKQVPEVLLGVNNSGKLVLTTSVDGKYSATYELLPSSGGLSTQQIKIGKGLYGRYWQFKLQTSDNSLFDLDEFEFMPVVFGRKFR